MISLKRDFKRRIEMQKKFPNHYPRFNIIDAIDMAQQVEINIDSTFQIKTDYKSKKPLTLGEKCCAVSHLLALEDFVKSNSNYCCIIEDDIIGSDKDFKIVLNMVEKIPLSSSVWILGGQQGMKNARHLSGYRLASNLWKIPKESMPFLTRACCYIIDREAAKKIIESQRSFLRRSDIWEYYSTLGSGIDFFYSNIFEHPTNLQSSHLEQERVSIGFINNILIDGLGNITMRYLKKALLTYKVIFGNLSRVKIK